MRLAEEGVEAVVEAGGVAGAVQGPVLVPLLHQERMLLLVVVGWLVVLL